MEWLSVLMIGGLIVFIIWVVNSRLHFWGKISGGGGSLLGRLWSWLKSGAR